MRGLVGEYQAVLTSDAIPIRPERICAELRRHVPVMGLSLSTPAMPACGWAGCTISQAAAKLYAQRRPSRLGLSSRAWCKCAVPSAQSSHSPAMPGLWYHIAEIETAARWRINAIMVVNNNASGNQSKRGFDRVYGGTQTEQARELWTFSKVSFARIAEEMGAPGCASRNPDFAPALKQALAANRPVVIDVVTISTTAPLAVT